MPPEATIAEMVQEYWTDLAMRTIQSAAEASCLTWWYRSDRTLAPFGAKWSSECNMTRLYAFTSDQASRLSGLSTRVLRYWEEKGIYHASFIAERRRVPYRRIYTFRDVVSLRTLAKLRKEYGVQLQELRRTGAYLRETYPDVADPWSELSFGVLNGRVVFRDPEMQGWVASHGQGVLPIDMELIAQATARDAAEFTKRRPEDIGRVVRHRHVLRNAWRLAGTRIPTSAVWRFYDAGAGYEEIRKEYPDLQEADIAAAIDHERRVRGLSAA